MKKTQTQIAFLRAVNVGGTGKLPMSDLKSICEELGFERVKTYIASGNVLFQTPLSADECKQRLEQGLLKYAGKAVGVFVRSPNELQALLNNNPFKLEAGNRTVAILLEEDVNAAHLATVKSQVNEQLALGEKAIYVFYGEGMADSKLVIPVAKQGTARNINTLTKMVALATDLDKAQRRG